MKMIPHRFRFVLAALLSLNTLTADAGQRNDVANRLSREDRRYLRNLSLFSGEAYTELSTRTAAEELEREVRAIFGAAPLALGSRVEGGPAIQEWIQDRLAHIGDLEWLGELQERVPVPVPLHQSNTAAGRSDLSTELRIGGDTFTLHPFWPNGALATLAPEGGLRGPLLDIGDGEWADLDGLEPDGAIVLMNFKGGRNWNRLIDLGAKAVIVVEDDFVTRPLAERFFTNLPLPFPRYFVDRDTGAALRARAGEMVEVHGGNWFEDRLARSLFAWLPPHEALTVTLRDTDLLDRVAAQFGMDASELLRANRLESPVLRAGQTLDLPGRVETYTVTEHDLRDRLLREWQVSLDELAAANEGQALLFEPGQTLRVPPQSTPMVLLVRTEAVSSVPGLPHGANAAANLAVALRFLDMAAELPEGQRRRGVLVAFLEGDVHGGRATRKLLETHFVENGILRPASVAGNQGVDEETVYQRYQEVAAWLETGEKMDVTAQWFVEEWLAPQLEKVRVNFAEIRVDAIRRTLALGETEEAEPFRRLRQEMESKIDQVVSLRSGTLTNRDLSFEERAKAFLDRVDELTPAEEGAPGLTREGLMALLLAEKREESFVRELRASNRETAARVWTKLHGEGADVEMDASKHRPRLGWWLNLSTGTPHLELTPIGDYRGVNWINDRDRRALVERFDRIQSFASLQADWREQWTLIGNDVAAVFPLLSVPSPPSYGELWTNLGVTLLPLRAANDTRNLIDTPLDTPDHLDFENLSTLARTTLLMLRATLESPREGNAPGNLLPRPVGRLVGGTTRFNIRSGIDARDPVPGTLVYFPAIRQPRTLTADLGSHNTATFMGNRIGVMQFSLLNGRYALPAELHAFPGLLSVHAYQTDAVSGLFSMLMDGGQIGTQRQSHSFGMVQNRDTFKNLIVYPLYPKVVSSGVEPLNYSVPNSPGELPQIQDAILRGLPRHVNLEHPRIHFGEMEVEGVIVYMEPGRRMVMLDVRNGRMRGMLLGDLDPEDETNLRGRGLLFGPTETDRNIQVRLTPLQIARTLQEVSRRRMDIYAQFGIRDQELSRTLELSQKRIDEAQAHVEARRWQQAIGASREAWGMLIKNYPAILRLGREAVLSVVILMALLAPTAVFLEKLVLGGKHIIARLGGIVLIFVLGTVFLKFFHPAFKIAMSPFIVVIAFTMILMASIVLSICYQRFEVLVRRARIQGGEAESEEISLASSLNTAFSLGVSNLKKRPTRTILTAFTVTVLTFSIVSFVSVRGSDTLFLRPVPLETEIQGVELDPESLIGPNYEGVLFREANWASLSTDFIDALRTEFGSRFEMTVRASYIEVAGGNNAALEGRNQIEIRGERDTEIVTALMAFEPAETRFTGLNQAVSHGHWFRGAEGDRPEDRFHIILPARVAAALNITEADLVDGEGHRRADGDLPRVRMMNQNWRVIGILDTETADRIRDVSGRSPALVDYLRSAITPQMGSGRLETEEPHSHMSWNDLAIVPVSARANVRASWSSLAVRFPEDFDFQAFRDELARRMDRAMYAHVDGETTLLSARKQQSIGGLAKVIVPIILCVLIVSNTMMGTVDERVSEVQMLGAIGLSPSQISFLLLSESTVFSCIGIIFGTFSGLLFSQIIVFFPESLGQLSFNFTSLASTFLAMATGGIVLVATLLPAKRAAALAAPSGMDKWQLPDPEADGAIRFRLPFTLTRGNATGMGAFFRRFLLNHVDSSSADFISKGAVLGSEEGALGVRSHMWLAPYDLDVAQDLDLRIEPTDTDGVFGVTIHLHRTSGTEDAWVRTNYGFLDLVRKQFLLWRNLDPALRKRYIQEGANDLQGADPA